MTILDALKYRLAKKGVDSEADTIAEAVKEMADNDNGDSCNTMLLIVEYINDAYVWEQNYPFDDIYKAAIEGRLMVQERYTNTMGNKSWDMAELKLPVFTNETHESGKAVFITSEDAFLSWTPNGFSFVIN